MSSNAKFICTSKRRYFSEWTAEIHAADINLEYGYEKFFVYECPCCNYYHLTTHKR